MGNIDSSQPSQPITEGCTVQKGESGPKTTCTVIPPPPPPKKK